MVIPFYTLKRGSNGYLWLYLDNNLPYVESCSVSGAKGKNGTWVYYHRYIVALVLGRDLEERVVFANGDNKNCSIENLLVQREDRLEITDRARNLVANLQAKITSAAEVQK